MSRVERRALQAELRKQAAAWPRALISVPKEQWPPRRGARDYPIAVWRSRDFLAQVYEEPAFEGREVRRLSVNRVTMRAGGRWDDGIAWEELMRLKTEAGFGDWYGLEVYPRERDVVNDANMRHLWLLGEPLGIGWFSP